MIRGYIEILTHCPNGGKAVEDNVLALEYRKSCSQIPRLKEAQLSASSLARRMKLHKT